MPFCPTVLKNYSSTSTGKKLTQQELTKIKNILAGMPGTYVRDLRFTDLMLPSLACHGIYAFSEGNNYKLAYTQKGIKDPLPEYWYIGKASGAALINRIANHFAPRSKDFANTLLKHIAYSIAPSNRRNWIHGKYGPNSYERHCADVFLAKAFPIIQDLKLKVIIFEEKNDEDMRSCIDNIENALINNLKPAFNYPKRFGNREFSIFDRNNQRILI